MKILRVALLSLLLPVAALAQDEIPDPETMSPEAYAAAVKTMCEKWADEEGVAAGERGAYVAECIADQTEE